MSELTSTAAGTPDAPALGPSEIDRSCRVPLLVMFVGSAVWLVVSSVLGLLASLRFHSPGLLADVSWLSYGRVEPAARDALLYGFCAQAGFGVALWLLARLGPARLSSAWLAAVGAQIWNVGVALGVGAILAGDSTGFVNLEFPSYSSVLLFTGSLVFGLCGALNFHQRGRRELFVSQWFLFAALFWFPWVYSTANLLLVIWPVRGVMQAVIAWWFSENLLVVWFGLTGIAALFYFVPRLSNRDLHSHYLGLFAFWTLILFGGWGGIPRTAPLPAWMPVLSAGGSLLMLAPMLAVLVNVLGTLNGANAKERQALNRTPLSFILFGVGAFVVAVLMNTASSLTNAAGSLSLTPFTQAKAQLQAYGFFAMVIFGASYYILPRLAGVEFPFRGLVRAHFWLAALGIALLVLSLGIGGIMEASQHIAGVPFATTMKMLAHFLRVSTTGEFLLLLAHLVFLLNIAGLAIRLVRARATAALQTATADLYQTAEAGR